jgi:hypothetical protein
MFFLKDRDYPCHVVRGKTIPDVFMEVFYAGKGTIL